MHHHALGIFGVVMIVVFFVVAFIAVLTAGGRAEHRP